MKETITNIYNLLNTLEIKGVQNIATMYKVLALLENMYNELNNQENIQEE